MKKILSLLIAVALLIPSASAFAEGTTSNSNKEARQAFKTQIKPQRDAVKALHEQNAALRESIKAKRAEIKPLIQGLRAAKDDASKEKLKEVKNTIETLALKQSRADLVNLRGAGKPHWDKLKEYVKSMNLNGALSELASISDIRTQRQTALKSIDNALSQILDILKK